VGNRKSLVLTETQAESVVDAANMLLHLRAPAGDTAIIQDHIDAATEALKEYLRTGLKTETYELTMDRFVDGDPEARLLALGPGTHEGAVSHFLGGHSQIDLPFAPVQSVTSIKVYDRSDTETTVSAGIYGVARDKIYLNEGQTWPTNLRDHAAVKITYVVGFGASDVPSPIVQAIREYVDSLYNGCGGHDVIDKNRMLLAPYKRMDQLPW
jgi:hypothetical protein